MTAKYFTEYGNKVSERNAITNVVDTNSYGLKRYFSNIESEIYFGGTLVEDIFSFNFTVDEKKFPIYGYNCFYPDLIVSGQRIVQGNFVVNYTNGEYVSNIISKAEKSILDKKAYTVYNPNSSDDRDKALWDKSFDIMLGYGYYGMNLETYNATCETIVGAKLVNMQKVLDTSGQPIMEVWSFIAKDYNKIGESTKKDNKKDDKKDDNKNNSEDKKDDKKDDNKNTENKVYSHYFIDQKEGESRLKAIAKDNPDAIVSSCKCQATMIGVDANGQAQKAFGFKFYMKNLSMKDYGGNDKGKHRIQLKALVVKYMGCETSLTVPIDLTKCQTAVPESNIIAEDISNCPKDMTLEYIYTSRTPEEGESITHQIKEKGPDGKEYVYSPASFMFTVKIDDKEVNGNVSKGRILIPADMVVNYKPSDKTTNITK